MKLSRLIPAMIGAAIAGILLGAPLSFAPQAASIPRYTKADLNIRSLRLPVGGLFVAGTSITADAAEINKLDGLTSSQAELNKLDSITGYPVEVAEVSFTETSGAGVYTGSVSIPAGATISDIIINGVALWNNAGAATMKVGDVADDDGYFTAIDLKATDLLAGESLSFALAGGKAGAYIANAQVSPRYSASARVISGIITTASTGGSTGRTRMEVIYFLPTPTAATKV